MKPKITPLAILMAINSLAFGLMAQITIDRADFPRGTTFTDNFTVAAQTNFTLPAEGAAQTWDFATGFTANLPRSNQYMDATGDPNFPNAHTRTSSDRDFQGFPIIRDEYESIDANGWYVSGAKISAADYSLQMVTGGPNDSLHILARNDIYAGRADYIQFPLNYQDAWINSRVEIVDFELSVASAGLNHTPGQQKRTVTFDREVVGYGTLTIPLGNGSPCPPFDALLIKSTLTTVDSFFVGGMPAPPPLLAAFSVSQGQSMTSESYIFYRKGFGFPVGGMSIISGKGDNLDYRSTAATVSLNEWDLVNNSSVYPNPVVAGKNLTIELGTEKYGLADFTLLDITGRKVFRQTGGHFSGGTFQSSLPESVGHGTYFYQLKTVAGEPLAAGKITVE